MRVLAALLGAVGLAGCAVRPPVSGEAARETLVELRFDQLPGWAADRVEQSVPALKAQCRRLALLPVDTDLGGQGLSAAFGGRAGQWRAACTVALALSPGDEVAARHFYERWFQPYRVAAPGFLTGYYEPEVRGSLDQLGAYQVPVLARPADLRQGPPPADDPRGAPVVGRMVDGRLLPYWTRAEIEAGRADGATHALLYLADPADLFFLQIQGSGRVRLPDGAVVRLGYDGKNGRAYTPIGRVLEQQGALPAGDVTMQSIRAWLDAHRAQARAVMDRNDDYVFFKVLTSVDEGMGPPGALGVDLLAGRSAAVDRHMIPLAAPVFVDTTDPRSGVAWRRLVLAQDLGTDISGAGRLDIFLGSGDAAEALAGRMRQAGTVYVLLPRPAA